VDHGWIRLEFAQDTENGDRIAPAAVDQSRESGDF